MCCIPFSLIEALSFNVIIGIGLGGGVGVLTLLLCCVAITICIAGVCCCRQDKGAGGYMGAKRWGTLS